MLAWIYIEINYNIKPQEHIWNPIQHIFNISGVEEESETVIITVSIKIYWDITKGDRRRNLRALFRLIKEKSENQ